MKLLITLDYELFFGRITGSPQRCLIDPVDELTRQLRRTGKEIKLCLFVDAGYLIRLQAEAIKFPQLGQQYKLIIRHLKALAAQGHEIQLHIHPHWEDSHFNGQDWEIDFSRYRLHEFSDTEIHRIVKDYTELLSKISGNGVFAYRAGGWCLQPFDKLSNALAENGVWLDSTVYYKGLSNEPTRWFDFTRAPAKAYWHFNNNPLFEDANGGFLEIPISSVRISPAFFWRLLFNKFIKNPSHQTYGDGSSMHWTKLQYFKMLTSYSYSVASVDGLKASLLPKACKQGLSRGTGDIFNLIGHPKALTPYSIKKLAEFISTHEVESVTYSSFRELRPR
ncbi:MAG TPA: hypothetical protein ENI64_09510 [Gammaproteobacteria bacterium]|nr:hypothetical protein [Gammaproteobacteria bacterium]